MQFQRIQPLAELKDLIECFWMVESDDKTPQFQKIIPDGFPEIIFHFGDPYKIKLNTRWQLQSDKLIAGQITTFFYLQNTGRSNILGIKLKPASLSYIFKTPMQSLTDHVRNLTDFESIHLVRVAALIQSQCDFSGRVDAFQQYLCNIIHLVDRVEPLELALASIVETNGLIAISEICDIIHFGERQLERLFRKHVGVSPKFYARIIRFNYIFQLSQKRKLSLSELGLESGYYDQSHFIRNFKAFTGEDPSRYFFEEPTLANFFLKK